MSARGKVPPRGRAAAASSSRARRSAVPTRGNPTTAAVAATPPPRSEPRARKRPVSLSQFDLSDSSPVAPSPASRPASSSSSLPVQLPTEERVLSKEKKQQRKGRFSKQEQSVVAASSAATASQQRAVWSEADTAILIECWKPLVDTLDSGGSRPAWKALLDAFTAGTFFFLLFFSPRLRILLVLRLLLHLPAGGSFVPTLPQLRTCVDRLKLQYKKARDVIDNLEASNATAASLPSKKAHPLRLQIEQSIAAAQVSCPHWAELHAILKNHPSVLMTGAASSALSTGVLLSPLDASFLLDNDGSGDNAEDDDAVFAEGVAAKQSAGRVGAANMRAQVQRAAAEAVADDATSFGGGDDDEDFRGGDVHLLRAASDADELDQAHAAQGAPASAALSGVSRAKRNLPPPKPQGQLKASAASLLAEASQRKADTIASFLKSQAAQSAAMLELQKRSIAAQEKHADGMSALALAIASLARPPPQ